MATGGGPPSISKTSEEIFDSECYSCSQDGKHIEADVFCVECGNNMCRGCLKHHNKFPQLRAHQIKDKSAVTLGTTQGAPHPPTEKCSEHDGRLIDTFCSRHDAVCCSVCVSENHRSCPDVSYIPKVASGISTSKELRDTQTSAKTLNTRLDTLRDTRHEHLEGIRRQRNEALERATMYKDELIERIEILGKKTAAEIMDKYKQLEDTIDSELDELSELIETLEDLDGKLKRFTDDETKLFVHLKTCKQYLSAGEKLEKTCAPAIGPDTCTFDIDSSIETYLKGLDALGVFMEDANDLSDGNIKAVHLSDETIKSSADTKTCRIRGICRIEAGGLILVDRENKCLKKLNKSFHIVDRCALPSEPWDVCQTSPTEVAVSLYYDKKIQFVSVGHTLSLTRSIKTNGDGYNAGIACRDNRLYVVRREGGGYRVEVYDMNGTLLQTIQKDKTGTPIFGSPFNITFSGSTSNMYVTDYEKGLHILNKSGELVSTVTDPDLKGAFGVCVLPGEYILVCGWDSNNIIQLDAQGQKVRTTAADGLKAPGTLHFDRDSARLFVGMFNSNTMKVYRIEKN